LPQLQLPQLEAATKEAQLEAEVKKLQKEVEAGVAAQEQLVHDVQVGEGLRKGEEIKARAEEETARVQDKAAGLLKNAAEEASRANLEDIQGVVKGAQQAVDALKQKHSSGGVAAALRGTTSQLADTVNQTSLHVSHFLRSFGPKASVVLTRSGDAIACKLSGDCNPLPDGEAVLPFDPEDPENWAFWGFAVFIVFALCGMSAGVLRCVYFAGRKGSVLLSEAMMPLTEPSAREPTIQLRSCDGLLG